MFKSHLTSSTTRFLLAASALIAGACMCTPTFSNTTTQPTLAPVAPLDVDQDATLYLSGTEERTLDPAKWQAGADGIIGDLYSGLVRLGVTLRPIPDLAESWDISPDNRVYTFHLRPGVTFHDGRPFTAEDVKYSWDRAAASGTESHTAVTYLGDIEGVKAVAAGEADSISGVKVIDELTLEVALDSAKIYFLDKLAYPAAWIVDRETIDDIETAPNGTGPFFLVEHAKNESYVLERNPNYHLGAPALKNIVYLVYADYPTRLYESGQNDIVTISKDLIPRAQDVNDPLYGNVQAVTGFCTNFVAFDAAQKPFDDPLVRRAFVQAIDKDRYNDVVMSGIGVIARGLYPPGLPGHTDDLAPLAYDAEAATRSLAESSYGGPGGLPQIVFTTFGAAGNISPADGLLIEMWQEALGVSVQAQGLDYDSYYDAVYAGKNGQIINSGWCADYPDPENFADLFANGSLQNHGNFNDPEVEELLARARVETDVDTRITLYQQIEQLLVDKGAGLFLSHSSAYYVVTRPGLKGYIATPIGVAQNMNLSISGR